MQRVVEQAHSSQQLPLDTQSVLKWHLRRWNNRLRLTRTAVWLPRGLLAGVFVGLLIAAISRLRPWLLPEDILRTSLLAVGAIGILSLVVVWLWPRSTRRSAQDFDRRFALKERISTALELSNGKIFAPAIILEKQLEDARIAANKVKPAVMLPLKVRWFEVVLLIGAILGLALALLLDNPFSSQVLARQALDQAIAQQVEQLEQLKEEIQNNENLTAEQQEELTQPLDEAIENLQQQDISQAEAVAAMAEAEHQLRELSSDGLTQEERDAYRNAGQQFAQAASTEPLGNELQEPDLNEASEETDALAEQLENMTPEEREQMADALDAAADALQQTNPELAEQLREAADALREGDLERAQRALENAAQTMQQEAQQNQQQANAAQQAGQQVGRGRRDLTELGQEPSQASQEQQGETQSQQGQQSSQQQQGNQAQQASGQQPGSQQGNQSQQQSGSQSTGQQSGQQNQTGQQAGQQPGQQAGQESAGQQAGQRQSGNEGQQGNQGQEGQNQGDSSQTGDANSSQAGGSGAGDTGSPEGSDQPGGQTQQPGNVDNRPGDDDMRDYTPIFPSQRIGQNGNQGAQVQVQGQANNNEGETIDQVRPNTQFSGQSSVPYNRVFREYYAEAQQALESEYIPIGLRDFIHAYFSSLEPQ